MTLETLKTGGMSVTAKDPTAQKLEALEESITSLCDAVTELSEKIHDLERNVAYALEERV